ncbi:SANT and BTB domain regulator of class switch recombination [Adelges cooleyi]|uniref:SANT and BTB domain regulator of class switch recombination n=1 Tax=Adelges cooleyi TaxID=133065 RepID=UPI00217FD74B|nr:SANT and BTB domain regulator of class switch recombination [Adelges cooleyi]
MNLSTDDDIKLEETSSVSTTIQNSQLSVQELLDFLIIAHRVNEVLANDDGDDKLHDTFISWSELAQNNLLLRLTAKVNDSETNPGTVTMQSTNIERAQCVLKNKLKEIMNEGILDSVLPYIVKKSLTSNVLKTLVSNGDKVGNPSPPNKDKLCSKQKSTGSTENFSKSRGDSEIEINVCDAVQKVKKVFRCPKRLLISKMGYFAEVAKGQRLEDIDISVHCEIPIFDWLIKWVKKDFKPKNECPLLDYGNVVPILVSASFLQMEPLFQECLNFCKDNINDVLSSSASFGCVNEGVITRLSNQFNNCDIENIKDVRDKLKSRLFTKLIVDLCKRSPKREFGHYSTFAYAFYCCRCSTVLIPNVAAMIPCKPPIYKIAQNGTVIACHSKDPRWTLNDHVKSLFSKHKCWRIVYWSLWSECHFLRCSRCQHMYPVKNHRWCQFHTQQPQFYPLENNRYLHYPIGRYPCCNEKTFKYEPIKTSFGCHYREHVPLLEHTTDVEIHQVMQKFLSLTTVDPPMFFSDGLSKLTEMNSTRKNNKNNAWLSENHKFAPFNEGPSKKTQFWWDNIIIGTPSTKRPLLTELWDKPLSRMPLSPNNNENMYESSETLGNEINLSFGSSFEEVEDSLSSFSDSDSTYSDKVSSAKKQKPKRFSKAIRTLKQRYRYSGNYQWSLTAPMRCNQDNQREYEERCFRQIARHVLHQSNSTTGECDRMLIAGTSPADVGQQPIGGCYVKLESELLSKIDPKTPQRPNTVDGKCQIKAKVKKTKPNAY